MWPHWFVRLKDEISEIFLTMKQMIYRPVMMILHCLWLTITLQEKTWIQNAKQLAEQDRLKNDDIGPNEQIQGTALAYEMTPPSLAVRSALRLQFWIFYWKLLREQIRLAKTLPDSLTETGQPVPTTAKLIPVLTENIDLFNNYMNFESISLCSLMKRGRYLVVNFGSCT
ncbi:unnamed protein product [Rotaria sp. Silwood1]|nr:unnamed protein product [Rotaria sp. Silwood1]CAF3858828.1 unnamed protein product [Rotaria sp. Silwood1]CAF3903254.1 unnamed protein product [Rotaria sp. Silwood1]CAF4660314.1 unnamed protein product [Rotaria sp. Silwood1]CAF4923471.1 unnamed protein product [Rotaria sp. Silwood1]